MKILIFLLAFSCLCLKSNAQADPTLAVGLETLTMAKGTIDVELLTEIIMEKQNELKDEALKRFMFNVFPEDNYVTKYYLQAALHILLNEKNPEVIKVELMKIITNYSLILGTTIAYGEIEEAAFDINIEKLEQTHKYIEIANNTKKKSKLKWLKISDDYKATENAKKKLETNGVTNLKNYELKPNHKRKINRYLRRKKRLKIEYDYDIENPKIDEALKSELFLELREKKLGDKEIDKKFKKIFIENFLIDSDKLYEEYKKIREKLKEKINLLTDNKEIKELRSELIELDKTTSNSLLEIKTLEYSKKIKEPIITTSLKSAIINLNQKIEEYNIQFEDTAYNNKLEKLKEFAETKKHTGSVKNEKKFKDLPLNLRLVLVGHVLSNMDELQQKGFFDRKLNYKTATVYQRLDLLQKIEVDDLISQMTETFTFYVKNYELLKEVYLNLKEIPKGSQNVFEDLKVTFKERFRENFINNNNVEALVLLNNSKETIDKLSSEGSVIKNRLTKLESNNNDFLKVDKKVLTELLNKTNSSVNYLQELKQIESIKEDKDISKLIDSSKVNLTSIENDINVIEATKTNLYVSNDIPYIFYIPLKYFIITIEPIGRLIIKCNIQNIKTNIDLFEKDVKKLRDSKNELIDKIIETELDAVFNKKNIKLKSISIFTKKTLDTILNKSIHQDSISSKKIAQSVKEIYTTLQHINDKEANYLSIVHHIENDILPQLVELSILSPKNHDDILIWKKYLENLNYLLYYNIFNDIEISNRNLSYKNVEDINELLKFLANLNNLDKAETFQHIFNLFKENNDKVVNSIQDKEFKNIYTLFTDSVKKYTLINKQGNYIEVDAVSFLVALEEYYKKNNNTDWDFYLGIGINQTRFLGSTTLPGSKERIESLGFAAEKIGVKYNLMNFRRRKDYANVIQDDIYLSDKSPFINEWYVNAYGSGLLYSLANTTTNQNFDYPHIGVGTGLRFYNALDFSGFIGFPLIEGGQPLKDIFIGIGFDIPLSEYLSRFRSKTE